MKATIRNKLVAGFSGVLLLMAAVAAIGGYAVFSLRRDANDATRVGARFEFAGARDPGPRPRSIPAGSRAT